MKFTKKDEYNTFAFLEPKYISNFPFSSFHTPDIIPNPTSSIQFLVDLSLYLFVALFGVFGDQFLFFYIN